MVKRVRGSRTGRPIMVLLDLLGRRWTLRIVWDLRDEPRRFRDLQASIGASPTIINTRLAELREARLVELDEAAGEHPAENPRAPGHGAEQQQRFDPRRHDAVEGLGDRGWVGRRGGSDAGHATVYVAR